MSARVSFVAVLAALIGGFDSVRAQGPVVGPPPEGPEIVIARRLPPWITVDVGAVFLQRSSPDDAAIGERVNLDTGEVLASVGTGALYYRFEAGGTVLLQYHRGDGRTFDLRWLATSSWADRAVLETTEADPIGTRTPISPFSFILEEGAEAGGIRARSRSFFHSFQAGRTVVQSETEDSTLTNYLGARYIYFRDTLNVQRAGAVDNEIYGWAANNHLVGVETGLDYGQHFGFMTFGAKGRIGGYANFADLTGEYDITVGSVEGFAPIAFETFPDDFTGISGVLEVGVYSKIQATQSFALKFGYDFIAMTNLVFASENQQSGTLLVTPVPGGLPTIARGDVRASGGSELFIHGFTVSGEVVW